jgi:hypothetical protein
MNPPLKRGIFRTKIAPPPNISLKEIIGGTKSPKRDL